MKNVLRDIIKAGALFFAVGAALALVAPPLATLLGPSLIGEAAFAHAITTPVIWTGAFFGAFGAIDAALRPIANWMFGDKSAQATDSVVTKEKSDGKQVNLTIVQSPQQSQEQTVTHANHRQAIEAERLVVADTGLNAG